jgi:hypothetical protein
MENPEKQTTICTKDTGRRQTKQNKAKNTPHKTEKINNTCSIKNRG